MCGIVGYAGKKQAAPILLAGLSRLEYRGYDSAGICVYGDAGLQVVKTEGRLQNLREKTRNGNAVKGMVGIGHTRWATHGAPSDVNSHPHASASGRIVLVHNGIIENEAQLRQQLEAKGICFQSETDTEVVANLVDWYYEQNGDLMYAVRKALAHLEGSYALAIMCVDAPDTVVAVKKDSPLIFGFGQGENFVASDVSAILKYTGIVAYLDDGEMAVFTADTVTFYNQFAEPVEKEKEQIRWELADVERGGYAHFMLKEIMEQPAAIRDTVTPCLKAGEVCLEGVSLTAEKLREIKKIYLVACGSAYYVSVVAKYTIERMCRIPTEAVMASEFRYSDPVIDGNNLVIVISQSGETADTLAALREAKRRGAQTLAIVNVVGSAIAKAADQVFYTWAGPEVAVATTKAFSAQLAAIYLLTVHMARTMETVTRETCKEVTTALAQLPDAVERALSEENMQKLQHYASRYCGNRNAFYIGRNMDSAICLEGSLKLKEVAYMHCEAYPGGELKHGPIALIEKGTLVVALATVEPLFDKLVANVREVRARGADVLCVIPEGYEAQIRTVTDHFVTVPKLHPMLQPSLSLIPLQLFVYYVAVCRGCDVDKPKNLAKSVTVE